MSERKPYRGDLSDARRALIEPMLTAWRKARPDRRPTGQPAEVDLRDVFNAILYVNRTGIPWKYLPHDFPNHGRALLAAAPTPRQAAKLIRAQLRAVLKKAGRKNTIDREVERLHGALRASQIVPDRCLSQWGGQPAEQAPQRLLFPQAGVEKRNQDRAEPASTALVSLVLDDCGHPPWMIRSARLVDLVNTMHLKLLAAAFGMDPQATLIYLADHVDREAELASPTTANPLAHPR